MGTVSALVLLLDCSLSGKVGLMGSDTRDPRLSLALHDKCKALSDGKTQQGVSK